MEIVADILKILRDHGPMAIAEAFKKAKLHDLSTKYDYQDLLEAQHFIDFSADPRPRKTWEFRPPLAHVTGIGFEYLSIWHRIETLMQRSIAE